MVALQIAQRARERGITIAQIQRETQLPPSTARRYFYSSKSGLERDRGTLVDVNLRYLERIAQVLEVSPLDLIGEEEAVQ
jgi:transcriptional regulator with XRE-family HTH domain